MVLPDKDPLLTASWVFEHMNAPDLVILDASFFLPAQRRDARKDYTERHLPGAQFFDIDAIADTTSPLPHMLPSVDDFANAVGQMGIGEHTLVVVYDDNDFMASARVWWTFRFFGHTRVRVLDGGLRHWLYLNYPVQAVIPSVTPQHFTASPRTELVCTLDAMLDLLDQPQCQIIDARPPGRFSGEEPEPRPGLRSGHIPRSRHLFFKELVDPSSHCLKSGPDLEHLFRHSGIDPTRQVTVTCGSGVTAAILALALYRIGNEGVAVYDGSWAEWGQHPEVPISRGNHTGFQSP